MPYRVSIWAVPLACPRSWQETDHQSGKHEPKEKGSTWRAGEVVAEEHAQTKARNAHAQVSKLQPMQGDPCGQLGCLIAGHRDRNTLDVIHRGTKHGKATYHHGTVGQQCVCGRIRWQGVFRLGRVHIQPDDGTADEEDDADNCKYRLPSLQTPVAGRERHAKKPKKFGEMHGYLLMIARLSLSTRAGIFLPGEIWCRAACANPGGVGRFYWRLPLAFAHRFMVSSETGFSDRRLSIIRQNEGVVFRAGGSQ